MKSISEIAYGFLSGSTLREKIEYTSLARPSESDDDTEAETGTHDGNCQQTSFQIHETTAAATTTAVTEAKTIAKNATPVALSLLLEYSLTTITIITVGNLGTVELGASSLAGFTANMTGYSIYSGLSTSLDTLCAQSYGSDTKHLTAVHLQRMALLLALVTIPLAALWLCAGEILVRVVPEWDTAVLAGSYLRTAVWGMPGYAAFEAGRKYIQAQGCYSAGMYVLLVCTPISALLNWFLVWNCNMGFIGAPIALAVTDNLLALTLFLYVYFFSLDKCWTGFTTQALRNWGPMIRLSIPSLLTVETETIAYGLNTYAASYLGPSILATQTVLSTISNIFWHIPYALSASLRIRIGNWIGAGSPNEARLATRVSLYIAVGIGCLGMFVLLVLGRYIARIFTKEEDVIEMVLSTLPVCAVCHVMECVAVVSNGILCAIGRQDVAGYVQTAAFGVLGLPVGIGMAFGLGWNVSGFWIGTLLALCVVVWIELVFLRRVNWGRCVQEAQRNMSAAEN